jgi:hypothetical protein
MDLIHCSKLPSFFDCSSSVVPARNPYNPPRMVANTGHAVHEAMADVVEKKEPDLDALSEKYNCDRTELAVLVAYGRRAWKELKGHLPAPRVEVPIKSDLVIGRTDVLHHDGDTGVILDWKSGRIRRNALNQVIGYGHAAADSFGMPRSGKITTIVVWLQFGEYEIRSVDREYLDQWGKAFQAQRKAIGKQWGPGDACTYCQRQLECGARAQYLRATCNALERVDIKAITPAQIADLWDKSRMLKKALEQFESSARMHAANGGIELPDGRKLVIQTRKKHLVDPMVAWPIMKKKHHFTDQEIASVINVKKTAIEETAKEKARSQIAIWKAAGKKPPRGYIGNSAKSILEDLKEADAITTSHYEVLDTIKPKP